MPGAVIVRPSDPPEWKVREVRQLRLALQQMRDVHQTAMGSVRRGPAEELPGAVVLVVGYQANRRTVENHLSGVDQIIR